MTAGLLHATAALLARPERAADPAVAALLATANAACFALLASLLGPVLARGLARFGARALALGLGLAVAGAAFVAVVPLALALPGSRALMGAVLALGALLALALGALVGQAEQRLAAHGSGLLRAAPLCALLTLGLVWAQLYTIESLRSLTALVWTAGWGLALVATFAAARRAPVDWALLPCLLAALWVWLPSEKPRPDPPADAPPIVLLSIDTLRADALRAYAPQAAPTPALEALLAASSVFADARSPAPATRPALASLMTGLSPLVHRAVQVDTPVDARLTTLAERLRDAGYATAAFASNPHLKPRFGLHQGFDTYVAFPSGWLGPSLGAWWLTRLAPLTFPPRHLPESDVTGLALEWLEAHADRPFFLWIHWLGPHIPYEPPAELVADDPRVQGRPTRFADMRGVRVGQIVLGPEERAWVRALYAGEVRSIDAEVGRVIAALHAGDLWDRAIVVFLSDHGEEFWEHDGFEHGHTVYDELLRVPFALRLPGREPGRIAGPVSTESLTPTLLDVLGRPAESGFTAPSLLPLLEGRGQPADARTVVSGGTLYFEEQLAVVRGDDKLVMRPEDGSQAYFDLASDPGEQRPRDPPPELAEQARAELARLHAVRAALGLDGETARETIDAETRAELRALGYLE